jgi:ABC-type multidrug transport system ATPase subunit
MAVVFDRVTAGGRRISPIHDLSFAVPSGSSCAIVGREGSGKTAILRCVLGDLRPETGRVLVLGLDARRERRALRRRMRYDEPAGSLRMDSVPGSELIVTSDPGRAAGADRVVFLKEGRRVMDDELPRLLARFRRIRYVNEITEARTEYGNELDLFDAVRVRVRGWGVDAVVSNYDDAAFEQFRRTEGVRDATAAEMSLEEIFTAITGSP